MWGYCVDYVGVLLKNEACFQGFQEEIYGESSILGMSRNLHAFSRFRVVVWWDAHDEDEAHCMFCLRSSKISAYVYTHAVERLQAAFSLGVMGSHKLDYNS